MKTASNPEIESLVAEMRAYLKRRAKQQTDLEEGRKDAVEYTAVIAKLGEPDYKDDAKVEEKAKWERKLKLCLRRNETLEEQRVDAFENVTEVVSMLQRGGSAAQAILSPIRDNRLLTITAIVRPFCATEIEAQHMARNTASYRAAWGKIATFGELPNRVVNRHYRHQIPEYLKSVEAVLAESLKSSPDLLQFLRIDTAPAEPTTAATSTSLSGKPVHRDPGPDLGPSEEAHKAHKEAFPDQNEDSEAGNE